MITKSLGRTILTLLSVALVLTCSSGVSANQAEITAVQVAPDYSSITIRSEGPLGKHSAFVIDRPFRLVVDFEATGLGKLQGKIKVDKGPMNEIRMGYHNNRARVVVDFGDNPAPPYQIERRDNLVVIAFGRAQGTPPRTRSTTAKTQTVPKPPPVPAQDLPSHPDPSRSEASPAQPAPAQTRPEGVPSQTPRPDTDDSTVSVKDAGVRNNLVFVELVNRKDPKLTYRLIVDLDMDDLSIRSASLSDSKGKLKKFEFLKSETELMSGAGNGARVAVGPRKHSFVAEPQGTREGNYQWGESSIGQEKTIRRDQKTTGWPLRIEEFQLQAKKSER